MKDLLINLGAGTEDDLESKLYDFMVAMANEQDIEWAVENQWGENSVLIGGATYRVQWQFVGLECEDYEPIQNKETGQTDYVPVGNWFWEYDGPDFEVSCMWKVQ